MNKAIFQIEKSIHSFSSGETEVRYTLSGHGCIVDGEDLELDDLAGLAEFLTQYVAEENEQTKKRGAI